jgi:hypothetical protein
LLQAKLRTQAWAIQYFSDSEAGRAENEGSNPVCLRSDLLNTELLHQSCNINDAPVFGDLAVAVRYEVHNLYRHAPAGRGNTKKVAPMSARQRLVRRYQVLLRDLVDNLRIMIGKRLPDRAEVPL